MDKVYTPGICGILHSVYEVTILVLGSRKQRLVAVFPLHASPYATSAESIYLWLPHEQCERHAASLQYSWLPGS